MMFEYAVAEEIWRQMIHVAVLLKPYLGLILAGEKTVECRLTLQARAPFEMIEPGDRIYLKQSAGPYRGMATAEHVICEGGLTPQRIDELKRDYNHLIRGPDFWWKQRRNGRFITLIWLADVQPIDIGPDIRPLQGAAWIVLEEEPAWRKLQPVRTAATGHNSGSFHIEVTDGNLRNNSLYVTKVFDRFPPWSIGGRNRQEIGRLMTLILHDGPTVQSDIVGPRKLMRSRVWGTWFRRHGAKPGDRVVFTPVDDGTFFVGLSRAR
jgi:hypothetical protein